MHTYHVTYFYLATGMEGHADTADHGYVEAWSAEEAKDIVGRRIAPFEKVKAYREWGLSAKRVWADHSRINEI